MPRNPMHLTDDEFLNDRPISILRDGRLTAAERKALTHYQEQARLAQFERMRDALRSVVKTADKNPFCWVYHLVEHGDNDFRTILRDVEGQ